MGTLHAGQRETAGAGTELETISDRQGSATLGLLAGQVLYVKFSGYVSQHVGEQYARQLQAILRAGNEIRMFKDCSALVGCDLLARSANVRVMLEHRKRLASMVVLTAPNGLTLSNHHLDSILERSVEYLQDIGNFEARLASVAQVPRSQGGAPSRRRDAIP